MWCKSNSGLEGECDGFSLICVCPVPVKTAGGYTHSRGCRFGLRAECQQETMIYNKQTGTRGQSEVAGLKMRSMQTDKSRKRESELEK